MIKVGRNCHAVGCAGLVLVTAVRATSAAAAVADVAAGAGILTFTVSCAAAAAAAASKHQKWCKRQKSWLNFDAHFFPECSWDLRGA